MVIHVKNNQIHLEVKYPVKTFFMSRTKEFELAHSSDQNVFFTITDWISLFQKQNATIFSDDEENEVSTLMTDITVKEHVSKVIIQLAKYTESIKNSIRTLVPKMIMNMLLGSLNKFLVLDFLTWMGTLKPEELEQYMASDKKIQNKLEDLRTLNDVLKNALNPLRSLKVFKVWRTSDPLTTILKNPNLKLIKLFP
uniref:GED domain-containing protein n=1 Tax=Rhabditophanes sp. KR3021 TaxID=114890 RepID=A0AC35TR74_9BILA